MEVLLRSHLIPVSWSQEAPSLCFHPRLGVGVAMAPEESAQCREMPGSLDPITHQVLCMWHPVNALIPQGDRSVMNWVIDQLVNEIYWIMQAAGLGVSLRGMGQIYEPGRIFRLGGWGTGCSPSTISIPRFTPGPQGPGRFHGAACSRYLLGVSWVPSDDPHTQQSGGTMIPLLLGRPGSERSCGLPCATQRRRRQGLQSQADLCPLPP